MVAIDSGQGTTLARSGGLEHQVAQVTSLRSHPARGDVWIFNYRDSGSPSARPSAAAV